MILSHHAARILLTLFMLSFVDAVAAPRPVTAQPEEFSAIIRIEQGSNAPMEMTYWIAADQFRMDMPEMSIIWAGGAQPRMLMIQHAERRYIEWGAQQLNMMQQMMGRMGRGGGPGAGAADPVRGNITFEATGNRETIGAWNAFEVQVQNQDGDQGQLWLSEDTEVGLFEIMASVVDMAAAMQMPMGMGGQQRNPQAMLQRYAEIGKAQGMPAGRAVRIVSTGEDQATSTLIGVQVGSIPADTFTPPADYQAMQMPAIPGRR